MSRSWTTMSCVLPLAVALLACAPESPSQADGVGRTSVVLLLTSDLHSRLFPEQGRPATEGERGPPLASEQASSVGGIARIAALVRSQRDEVEATFFLDAGDLVEGSALYPRFGGEPELRAMTAAGIDARALGNHDGALLDAQATGPLTPPLLAANLVGDLGSAVEPLVVLRRGGVTVAVIGAGRLESARPDLLSSAEAVREAVASVRAEADVVVLLSHLGSELDAALLGQLSGIDVVLGGHSHDVLAPATTVLDCGPRTADELGCRPRPVPLVHAGAYGRFVGRVQLLVSRAPADLRAARDSAGPATSLSSRPSVVLEAQVQHVPVGAEVPEDPEVVRVLDPYLRALVREGLYRPLAVAPRRVPRFGPGGGDSALGNLVAAAARAETGAELAVIPASALRADIDAGEVTGEILHRVLPFEDRLVALNPSGAELSGAFRRFAEGSCQGKATDVHVDGATVAFACGAGEREVLVAGARLDPAAFYRVITSTFFTQDGGPFDLPARVVGDPAGGETVRARMARWVQGLPACGQGARGLPCLDEQAGALVDGRIRLAGGSP